MELTSVQVFDHLKTMAANQTENPVMDLARIADSLQVTVEALLPMLITLEHEDKLKLDISTNAGDSGAVTTHGSIRLMETDKGKYEGQYEH